MADEGVLTAADVRSLAASGSAQVLNLRLSKNGGLGRVLTLAAGGRGLRPVLPARLHGGRDGDPLRAWAGSPLPFCPGHSI